MMRNITFFFRNGGIIVSQIKNDNHTATNIGQRMSAGGFISASDSFWGRSREVVINLADVSACILSNGSPEQGRRVEGVILETVDQPGE